MATESPIAAHYTREGLLEAIEAGLRAVGADPAQPSVDDLSPIDEFHVRGREATAELAHALAMPPGSRVLDIGSGLGGPARYLAARHGLRVTGLDLTPDYVEVAGELARRCGLGELVTFVEGDATSMPFEDATFEAAYTQHVAMNIEDKPRLYAEIARVLQPGAPLVIYDILQGPGGEVLYPTPWSRDGSGSFLVGREELVRLLEAAGLGVLDTRDRRAAGAAWFASMRARAADGPPPLGLHLLFGPIFREMGRNMLTNVESTRIIPTFLLCRRN